MRTRQTLGVFGCLRLLEEPSGQAVEILLASPEHRPVHLVVELVRFFSQPASQSESRPKECLHAVQRLSGSSACGLGPGRGLAVAGEHDDPDAPAVEGFDRFRCRLLDRVGYPQEAEARSRVPYVAMIDDDDVLQRLVVDDELIRSARRCAETWHSLQELSGTHDSHARLPVAREGAAWEEEKERELEELRSHAATPGAIVATTAPEERPAVEATVEAGEESEPQPEATTAPPDEPYIETARCTTCGGCIGRNALMFAYDENKQAYIVDPDAGTFRNLVEAAEACQVAIIHPGKPRNPDEPGLPELIERAAAFN